MTTKAILKATLAWDQEIEILRVLEDALRAEVNPEKKKAGRKLVMEQEKKVEQAIEHLKRAEASVMTPEQVIQQALDHSHFFAPTDKHRKEFMEAAGDIMKAVRWYAEDALVEESFAGYVSYYKEAIVPLSSDIDGFLKDTSEHKESIVRRILSDTRVSGSTSPFSNLVELCERRGRVEFTTYLDVIIRAVGFYRENLEE